MTEPLEPTTQSRFVQSIGCEFGHDADGTPWVRLEVQEMHRNSNRVVHGSVIHALLDSAMGREAYRARGKRPIATAEISVRFLAPVFDGVLEARARVLKAGKRLVFAEGQVRHDGELVAVGQGTFAAIGDDK